jgi:hypothetical protein
MGGSGQSPRAPKTLDGIIGAPIHSYNGSVAGGRRDSQAERLRHHAAVRGWLLAFLAWETAVWCYSAYSVWTHPGETFYGRKIPTVWDHFWLTLLFAHWAIGCYTLPFAFGLWSFFGSRRPAVPLARSEDAQSAAENGNSTSGGPGG